MAAPELVKLHYMAADPADAEGDADKIVQGVLCRDAGPFLDGPVHRRLAVVDLDPDTGRLRPGVPLILPKPRARTAHYAVANLSDPDSAGFRPVSVFATVWETMQMFEEPDVLGRSLRWGFQGEQLLIVPEAGIMANAFYHRASRSLQFFSFAVDGPDGQPRRAHTCLSPDIVAHEATHAILDGIAPDLYDAKSPQSLALHEAMSDLAAVIFAARTQLLCRAVLDRCQGDLRKSESFSGIAQQLGGAGQTENAGHPLRDLSNDLTLRAQGPNPASQSPHDLSLVLTGAFYALFLHAFDHEMAKRPQDLTSFSASGRVLNTAANLMKRMAFRALDYLPPGEISFADYARAVMEADRAANPGDSWPRDFLTAEFVRRGIVERAEDLAPAPHNVQLPDGLDLDQLIGSEWVAYQFAEQNRAALMIPEGTAYALRPRLDVVKTAWRGDAGKGQVRQVIVKLAWEEHEWAQDPYLPDGTHLLAITRGTTLVIDRDTGQVQAVLTTGGRQDGMAERASFVRAALASGALRPDQVQVTGGRLRLCGTGTMLHMVQA